MASAAVGDAPWAIPHGVQPIGSSTQPFAIGLEGDCQYLSHPGGQRWMQAVIDPLALPAVLQQVTGAQLRQMAGNLGLALFQCAGQLTDAELLLAGDQQHHPDAILIGEAFENLEG